MPPPMPNPSKRMTANPAKPVQRYRPGKVLEEAESSDEDDEDEEEIQRQTQPQRRAQPPPRPARKPRATTRGEESEDEDEEGFVTDEDEDEDGGVTVTQATSGVRDISTKATESRPQETEDSEEDSKSEDESSEEESSSGSEPQRKFQRPTFIKKSDRKPDNSKPTFTQSATNETSKTFPDEQENSTTRRLTETEALIADRIARDALARAAGKKSWDDDDAPEEMVDDTDGLDPAAEHAAWKLRELKRLKRDREAIETREREIEELERRKALTTEQREAEDAEYISRQKEEKEVGRGETAYLARYHHKGAFFQDDEAARVLAQRDIMGAKFVDEVDKEKLPEYMKIRDMTKLGKKGRTRYTDLKGQDTGAFGRDVMRWRPGDARKDGDSGVGRGVDERFQPDRDWSGGSGPTGANASAVGERRRSRTRSPRRERRDDGDTYRSGRRDDSRSRSRSPPRRKRSPSPYRDRDKRRRVDAM